jgi:hypothetical protein
MHISANSKKSAARTERRQERLDAGLVSTRFPEIASIAVSMIYNQKEIAKSLPRIVNFFPGSYAVFRVDCLTKNCLHGGFDLDRLITTMIRNRREASRGELSCQGEGPSAGHSGIVYKIVIQYL